jgi:hypothetical protein
MIVRSKKLWNKGRVLCTTIGLDQDSEKKIIKEVKDEETKKTLIPRSILTNADGLSPWKIRGSKFAIFPEGTLTMDGVIEELEGGDYSWYKAKQLPHPALTEHLFRTEVSMREDNTVEKKIIPIMPNFNYDRSEILWSPTGWNGGTKEIVGEGCNAELLRWQEDRITKLEDEVRYWRGVMERTVVVAKEEPRGNDIT